jgi:hypothetical protein
MNAELAKPIHTRWFIPKQSLTDINDLLRCGFPGAICRDDG